ncbi:MAG TPA: tetratricopeptide repeat protein [Cytophagales bacterium]|nr:tetratricopeptide repeat protein [Cytophagales bacterium]
MLSQSTSQEGEFYFAEGMKFYILEDYPKAMVNFSKVLEINPDNAANHFIIAEVLEKEKKYSEALFHALKALELEDKNKYYYTSLAGIYESLQKNKEAIDVYLRLLKVFPNTHEVFYDLANNYLALSRYDEALEWYNKIEDVYGVNEDVTRQKQQIYLKQNKLNEALAEGETLIMHFPDEPIYKINQVELLVSNNKSDEGLALLESIAEGYPDEPYSRVMLWEMYKERGNVEKAEENLMAAFKNPKLDMATKVKIIVDFIGRFPDPKAKATAMKLGESFLKTHPDDPTAYTLYGDLLRNDNKKEEALSYYAKASRLDESNFNVWQWLVSLNFDLNRIDSALVYSDKALELFPNQPEFWYFSGVGYFMKKNYKRSTEILEQAKALSLTNQGLTNQINTILGDAYNNLKEYKKSDAAYEEVLKNNPNEEHVINNYSYFLSLRKEKLELAKDLSSKLIKAHPENATYLDTHAWVLYMLKDYSQAHKLLEKAVKLSPTNGAILEHYGDVLFKIGEKAKALENWIKAKEAGETSELINKKISEKTLYE